MPKTYLKAIVFLFFISLSSSVRAESISIQTFDAQSLSGIVTLPTGNVAGAVLILQGSGNVGADGDVSGPFLGSPYHGQSGKLSEQIATQLASAGIASLRYAKRGVDDQTQLVNQTESFLEKDAESALLALKKRFPTTKIGVVGFSEGAHIATRITGDIPVDALYLLSLPIRQIDETFGYQFIAWPIELFVQHFDPLHTGSFAEPVTIDAAANFNLLDAPTWANVDVNQDHQISVDGELRPAYQKYYNGWVRDQLQTPALLGWYHGLEALPPFADTAAKIMSPFIFIYQGNQDAQTDPNWVQEDSYLFKVTPKIQYFDGGHCFSPMDGPFGGVKTSGPFSGDLLNQLAVDVLQGLK